MRKMIFASITCCLVCYTSCQKALTANNTSRGTPGIDSAGTPGNSNLLVKLVSTWNATSAPGTDSIVTLYNYDAGGHIILKHPGTYGDIYYYPDSMERIIKMGSPSNTSDSSFTYVQYKDDTGTQVLYMIANSAGASSPERDSTAFNYSNRLVAKTSLYATIAGSTAMVNYQTYTYDGNGNVTQLDVYLPDGTLNIGYDFMYDGKGNPQYAADDARLPQEWGYILSPNNVIKQVNHYGNPPQMPDDEVTLTYTYNAGGLPIAQLEAGNALGQQTCLSKYYYK